VPSGESIKEVDEGGYKYLGVLQDCKIMNGEIGRSGTRRISQESESSSSIQTVRSKPNDGYQRLGG